MLLACRASCQKVDVQSALSKSAFIEEPPSFPSQEIINHIGSEVYIIDTIAGYKVINKRLKLLYLGYNYPHQLVTVVISGRKTNRILELCKAGMGYFSGKAVMYEGKPAIIITDPYQVTRRIQL